VIAEPLLGLVRPVAELRTLEGNPRRGDVQAVKRSLQRFGQRKPIVVREDGTVIAGNHTLLAAIELGWAEIAVVGTDDDDATAKAYALADNRTSALGSFDPADLALMAAEVHAVDPALLEAASFTEADLNALLNSKPKGRTDPDDVPEPPAEPVTRPGDLWQLGPHRLLCGDSTEPEDVDRLLDGAAVAYTFTSPPYGIDLEYEQGEPLDALVRLVSGVITQIDRVSGADAYATVNYADVFRPGDKGFTVMSPHYDGPFRACGWHLRGNRVWFKPFGRLALSYATSTTMNLREWEYVWTWRRGIKAEKLRAHGITVRGVWQSFGDAILPDWRSLDVTTSKETHPAAFPVMLPVAGMRAYSDAGDAVLDPFGGSGSTLIAAHIERRVAYLMEIDPRYCDVIVQRYRDHTGIEPVLL
jgi:site-specific DNA-methyltransferase (adenine-specific)